MINLANYLSLSYLKLAFNYNYLAAKIFEMFTNIWNSDSGTKISILLRAAKWEAE